MTRIEYGLDNGPAWVPCPCCENFQCQIHAMHVHDCPCLPVEEWDVDPYSAPIIPAGN